MPDERETTSVVARRINGERLVLLGWPCAILMQVAHPLVAAGVARHSTFRDSAVAPVQRLHHTVRAMLGLTFGSPETRERAVAGIREIHTRVHGTLTDPVGRFAAGTRYSAEDPSLLLWVHATLIDTMVTVYEALVGPLTLAERDEYCRDSASVAVALGATRGSVPVDWHGMRAYVATMLTSGELTVGPDARELARTLLYGPAFLATGPMAWASRQLTAGWLPPTLRAEYELTWNARRERRFQRLVVTTRRLRVWMPEVAARWPEARLAT